MGGRLGAKPRSNGARPTAELQVKPGTSPAFGLDTGVKKGSASGAVAYLLMSVLILAMIGVVMVTSSATTKGRLDMV